MYRLQLGGMIGILAFALCVTAQPAENTVVFERVFGIPRFIDDATLEQVKALEAGSKLERDTNGDGVVDELWYLDTAKRHNITPLLVRVVDEDGDMAETMRGDLDSDCYFWDHGADGSIDVVTDYVDDDGDNDVDQMGIFYDKRWPDEKDDLTVWWSVDVGDDNKLWFDVNGNYYQPLSQWRTHFGGDELFYQFRLSEGDEHWVNVWEDPFAFYDLDADGSSEMVIRISAIGDAVKNLRYSIDADDDAYGERTRNYDFSITALPPESGMSSAEWAGDSISVRGIETLPLLAWDKTQPYALQASWAKAMLSWDEINSNTDNDPDRDPNERWEGILNHASKHGDFEQVGGPPCSVFNKRIEVSHAPKPGLPLYYNSEDWRFHLENAKYGYLDVDYNFDGEIDAAYTWEDTDADGRLDRRTYDMDADGTIDFEHSLSTSGDTYSPTFEDIAEDYKRSIADTLNASQTFIDAAGDLPESAQAIITYFNETLVDYHPETEQGIFIRKSPAGNRFYTDLVRDHVFVEMRKQHGDSRRWDAVESAYFTGDYDRAAKGLRSITGESNRNDINKRPLVIDGETYSKRVRIDIEFEQDQPHPCDAMPYSAYVSSIVKRSPDFNTKNCVVVDGDYHLAWRVIPHQVDDWEIGGEEKLSFLADIPANGKKTYYIYYAPGERTPDYPKLTNAVLDNPAYVAWESDAGAYRFYTGQFDFFGKHESRIIPRSERLIYPLIDVNYHAEQDWGIDALHVGTTSGLGGLTLYEGGKAYPIQSPAGEGYVKFEHEVLGAGPVRSAVAIRANGVLPHAPDKVVELRCFTYAQRTESHIHVRLPDGLDNPQLGVGIMDLPENEPFELLSSDSDAGALGTWGYQGDDIGEIGLATIVPQGWAREIKTLDHERQLINDVHYEDWDKYHFHYWITGSWRRGMQYPVGPSGDNWQRHIEDLSIRLATERKVDIYASEDIR